MFPYMLPLICSVLLTPPNWVDLRPDRTGSAVAVYQVQSGCSDAVDAL